MTTNSDTPGITTFTDASDGAFVVDAGHSPSFVFITSNGPDPTTLLDADDVRALVLVLTAWLDENGPCSFCGGVRQEHRPTCDPAGPPWHVLQTVNLFDQGGPRGGKAARR